MAVPAAPAASVHVTFTATLSPDLARKLGAAASGGGPLTAGPLAAYLERAAQLVEDEAVKRVPDDEGGLKRAMGHRVASGGLAEIFNTSPHAVFVHGTEADGYTWGRRPGAKAPPPDELAGWAERHGFSLERGVLFALARKIGAEGIKARPFLTDALAAKAHEIEGPLLRQLAGDVERAWAR